MKALAQGLGQAMQPQPPQQPPVPCPTDPQAYQQFQQQYQYQMQQYQYQMQLHMQQQQQQNLLSQLNGGLGTGFGAPLPSMPSQCTPQSQSQCPQQIPPPNPAACTTGTWVPSYNGACVTNWQCIQTKQIPAAPEAKITCEPSTADVGMDIAISYSCTNSARSDGEGFNTDGRLQGRDRVTIGSDADKTATYTLTCKKGELTTSARCTVQVSKPSIVMVANPQTVAPGEASSIGWITTGMKSCTVSSDDMPSFTERNASNTSVNGMATTDPINGSVDVTLRCTTLGGATKSAVTTIRVQ